jgi:sugar phosphate isomerase/epimerase
MISQEEKLVSRRAFLSAATLGIGALAALGADPTGTSGRSRLKVIGFIKPFQKLPFEEIADVSRTAGWDGVECPVRKGGTIEPEAAEEKLPGFVETMRKHQLEVPVIATDVEDAQNPVSQRVLKAASKLGIKRYRLKHYYYDLQQPIAPQLRNFAAKLRDLAQLNGDLGLQGAVQNHSGRNYVGAPVWDLWELMRDLDPKRMGIFFDIGHATIEGGYAWPIHAKLAEPLLAVVSVKDFAWEKNQKGDWRAEWCPLGDGMVRPQFFETLRKSAFGGPVSMHFEYNMGEGKQMLAAMKKDTEVLRRWLGS